MRLTKKQKALNNFEIHAYIDDNNEGFVLGGDAKVIPQSYIDKHNDNKLKVLPVNDGSFKRVIDRTNVSDLKNHKPAYARITKAGSLIIE